MSTPADVLPDTEFGRRVAENGPAGTDHRDVMAAVLAVRLENTLLDAVFPNHTPSFLGIVFQDSGRGNEDAAVEG